MARAPLDGSTISDVSPMCDAHILPPTKGCWRLLPTLGAGDIHRPWLSPLSIATRERYSADLYEMSYARRSKV
jgi:hypothetical protein